MQGFLNADNKFLKFNIMDEKQFYIDNNLPGIWENERYSFFFQLGMPKLATFTDKEKFPKTSVALTYQTFNKEFDSYLRIITANEGIKEVSEFKIDTIDGSAGTLTLSNEGGQSWTFKKV